MFQTKTSLTAAEGKKMVTASGKAYFVAPESKVNRVKVDIFIQKNS